MNLFIVGSLIASAVGQPATRSGGLSARIPNACSTITGSQCVFPFTYKGEEHYGCTYDDSPTPWCATQVDSAGVVVTNKWGDCETGSLSSCQTESIELTSCTTESGPYPGQSCVFPFRYNGVTYTSCTTQDKNAAWCSTQTTLAGTHVSGSYGYCPSSCPADGGSAGSSCTPGTSYTLDCNTCVCAADGEPVCTTNNCGTSSTTTTTVAPSTSCTPGQVSTVDCNTCVCSSLGEQVCTNNICTTTSAPSTTCTTVSGPDTGSQCVFPFTFSGTTYQSCTEWTYGGESQGSKWCSTKVDSQGVHVNGEGNYGFCGGDCNLSVNLIQDIFGTNTRLGSKSRRNKDAVVFGNRDQKPK